MEEKRLECLIMMLTQIHRTDTAAVTDRFATTAARKLNFFNMNTCTSVHCTDSYLNVDILKYIIS